MSANLLDKYVRRVDRREHPVTKPLLPEDETTTPLIEPDDALESEEAVEDGGCFGYLRGIRDRAIMLELRKRDSDITAIGYAWIERIEFSAEQGIRIFVPGRIIHIQGFGLNASRSPDRANLLMRSPPLFEGLTRHRVTWVMESIGSFAHQPRHRDIVVEAITIQDLS